MVLDASAIVAIIQEEPGAEELVRRIDQAEIVVVGAPTLLEAGLVLTPRLRRDPRSVLAGFLRGSEAEVIPFTEEHYLVALAAFNRYGKGRHPAALNLGDCLTYAVARVAGMPLLFTGEDFSKTDIPRAK
jgi:ribonuclease VapC